MWCLRRNDQSQSDCSNLTQKEYKTRHDWRGKVIYRDLCKKLKFDHTTKWYMLKQESFLENETHKILWDFGIQIDRFVPARRPDLVIIDKKENQLYSEFAVMVDHRVKIKENKKRDTYFDLDQELKKLLCMKITVIPVVNRTLRTIHKGLFRRLEELEIGGQAETIQTTALLRSARILRKVLETWDLRLLRL